MIASLRPRRPSDRSQKLGGGTRTTPPHRQFSQVSAHLTRRITLGLTTAALALTPAAAQRVPPADSAAYARAIAAGYKAAITCSAMFNAGRTQAQIDQDELSGIYPEYDAIVPAMAATVRGPQVSVPFSPSLPPRFSVWGGVGRGCLTFPIGTALAPSDGRAPRPIAAGDPRPWPQGDGGIRPSNGPALRTVVTRAFNRASYGEGKTIGVVALRDGVIVAERYASGWGPFVANRTWSAAKSIAGTLVGLAGLPPHGTHVIAAWNGQFDPRAAITLDNLLRMASGLHTDTAGNRTDAIYFGGTAVDEQVPGLSLDAAPGTRFRYSNSDILLAVMAMRDKDPEFDSFPERGLFAPLGMRHTVAEQGWRHNYILSSQVWSTARDLARLGQFWLQDGVWQGKRLLPEGWIKYMTTPSGPQPADGPGYGATLWLFGPKQGLPAGSYAAQGNRGQYIMVVPSERLVVVRRGEDPGAARFDIARFTADIIAAGK